MSETVFDIHNYLQVNRENGTPVCREERQYAALLYMAFVMVKTGRANDKERELVWKCLGLDAVVKQDNTNPCIKEVFFEATLMRDYFERIRECQCKRKGACKRVCECQCKRIDACERVCECECRQEEVFNCALLAYCANKHNDTTPFHEQIENKSHKKYLHQNLSNKNLSNYRREYKDLDLAVKMMASKPDIAVLYKKDGELFLVMLGCKYKSPVKKNGADTQIIPIALSSLQFIYGNCCKN